MNKWTEFSAPNEKSLVHRCTVPNGLAACRTLSKALFTLGVKVDVQLKSSIPIGAKLEISPNGFTLRVKAEIF
jgi:hypothetical protein